MSRITRSASAASGTFSTKLVVILSPNAASTALRALSCANVQPASPTGPTYANAILSGLSAGAVPLPEPEGSGAVGGAAAEPVVPLGAGSFLLQPSAAHNAPTLASRYPVFLMSMVNSRSAVRY